MEENEDDKRYLRKMENDVGKKRNEKKILKIESSEKLWRQTKKEGRLYE